MNFELLRIVIALVGTAVLAYQDHKTSFVDEKIIYAMIVVGILLDILTLDSQFILFAIGGAAIIGIIGYYLYKTGQFGLGDSLLFVGLHALLPFPAVEIARHINATPLVQIEHYATISQVIPFILSIAVTASVLALVGSSVGYAYSIYKNKKMWQPNKLILAISTIAAVTFIAWFQLSASLSILQLITIAIICAASIFAVSTKEQVMRDIIVKQLRISQIEDEDILAIENIDKKLVKQYKLEKVLTQSEVEKLKSIQKNTGRKLFPVYKNLPRFIPYVLVSLVIHLLYLNAIAFFIFL